MKYTAVVISGCPGSGKSTLARKVGEIHNWPVYSIGELWRSEWKKKYPNKEISFENYWKNTSLKENRDMDFKARGIAAKGYAVIDMRYANCCFDLDDVLRIFVHADLNTRVRRAIKINKYPSKSPKQVKKILKKREKDELKMGKKMYGQDMDYRDLDHYHIVLNSRDLSVDEEIMFLEPPYKTKGMFDSHLDAIFENELSALGDIDSAFSVFEEE